MYKNPFIIFAFFLIAFSLIRVQSLATFETLQLVRSRWTSKQTNGTNGFQELVKRKMCAKYVSFSDDRPSYSASLSAIEVLEDNYKRAKVHIYQNYERDDESSEDEVEEIRISRCVPKVTGDTNAKQAVEALTEDDRPCADDNFNSGYLEFFMRNYRQFTSISGGN